MIDFWPILRFQMYAKIYPSFHRLNISGSVDGRNQDNNTISHMSIRSHQTNSSFHSFWKCRRPNFCIFSSPIIYINRFHGKKSFFFKDRPSKFDLIRRKMTIFGRKWNFSRIFWNYDEFKGWQIDTKDLMYAYMEYRTGNTRWCFDICPRCHFGTIS